MLFPFAVLLSANLVIRPSATRLVLLDELGLLEDAQNTSVNETDTESNKPASRKPLVPFRKKRLEASVRLHPVLPEVNWGHHAIVQRLSGRWFGVQGAGNHSRDYVVIDILRVVSAGLRLESNVGLAGEISFISTMQLVAASKHPTTVFQVQTAAGKDTMYISINHPDTTYHSLLMVPSEAVQAERTEYDDEVIALFRVSDWLDPEMPSSFPSMEMYNRLHVASTELNKVPSLPQFETVAEAQRILPSAFNMPDWTRNAFGENGTYAGGSVARGPHKPRGREATPSRSAMKGSRQAKKASNERR